MGQELTSVSAARLAALIRRREVSPVEAAEAYLRRIESLNPALNAVVTLAPDVLERAREAERASARGDKVGPLHGVPVTVKDTIEVRGLPAAAGSRVRAGLVAERDAGAVARLRAAGAVVLGKTNCSEMALDYTTENPVFGRTLNPHDPRRTPGGSSGGCAAAVAARLSAASLGSDLAGSVRIPAHFCGVAGLRPTAARVPTDGHCPPVVGAYALGASLGPLARSVEDLRLFYDALSLSAPSRPGDLRGRRVAWYEEDGEVPVTDETKRAVRAAAAALADAGLEVSEGRPPGVGKGTELWLALFSDATRQFLRAAYAGRETEAGPTARALIESVAPADASEVSARAREGRDLLRAELLRWMEATPLFVSPVGAVAAFRHEESRRVEVGGRVVGTFRAFGYAQVCNVFDLPAVCVPAGRTRDGLPVGVQLVGRPFEEDAVLAAAALVERALGGFRPPTNLPNGGANQL
ncbi:MAG TPA: amidase [Pyrinomonadaceae bacterium]|nr:amidase [Pyrinomonadaceae bacterium]